MLQEYQFRKYHFDLHADNVLHVCREASYYVRSHSLQANQLFLAKIEIDNYCNDFLLDYLGKEYTPKTLKEKIEKIKRKYDYMSYRDIVGAVKQENSLLGKLLLLSEKEQARAGVMIRLYMDWTSMSSILKIPCTKKYNKI